jgi:hypothetical protein
MLDIFDKFCISLFYVRNFRKIRHCFLCATFATNATFELKNRSFLCFHFLQNFHFLFMLEILEDYRTLHRFLVLFLSFICPLMRE